MSKQHLKPLSDAPLQAYLDNHFQLFDIIAQVLDEIGTAEIYISTFSIAEEFIRRLFRLKQKGLITHSTLLLDIKAVRKTLRLSDFVRSTFDEVKLAQNHSKVILFLNKTHHVSVITSQNQTRGNRYESGIITTDATVFTTLYNQFNTLIDESIPFTTQ